jgi:hypothetical protein
MKTMAQIVAWLCIFSTFFMGCYGSAMIDPTGDEKEKIYSGTIESVVTKDGTEYKFDKAPAIVKDAVVGEVVIGDWDWGHPIIKQVSIPLSNVAEVSVSEISTWRTVVAGSLGLGIVGYILVALTIREGGGTF